MLDLHGHRIRARGPATRDRIEKRGVRSQLVGGHAERKGDARRDDPRLQPEIPASNAGETGFFTLRILVGEKNKRLVFFDWAAERETALRARVGLFHRIEIAGDRIDLTRKGITRLKGLVTEVPEGVSVKIVGATLAHDVDDAATGAAVFSVVVAQNELKLLYALLREGRANGVDGVVDGIRPVNAYRGSTRARTADAQAAVRSRANGRRHVTSGL